MNPLLWRLRFALFEVWGKPLHIILYTLFPTFRHKKHAREKFLIERSLMKWNKGEKYVEALGMKFFYPNRVPTGNIISIILGDDPYVKKNFVENSALKQEGPYEVGGAQLKQGDVVLDAGANLGIFSVLAGKKVGENGQVYAFEPIPAAQEVLKRNIHVNDLANVSVESLALGDTEEMLTFMIEPKSLGSSTAKLHNPKATEKLSVRQTTIDAFVQERGIERVGFIKADIEGMEREMLRGAEETIKRDKPKLAICVYHLEDDPEVIRGLVESFVPEYTIRMTKTKLYAWVA